MSEIEFESALICEDIRQEANGKLFAAGIYTGDILVASLPATLALRCLLVLRVKSPVGLRPANFEWLLDGDLLATLGGRFEANETASPAAIPLPSVGMHIPKQGTLSLDFIDGDDRLPIISRRVQISHIVPSI